MRIGLVIENLDPRLGGAEQWTWQFAQRLLELGLHVHGIAKRFAPEVAQTALTCHELPPLKDRWELGQAVEHQLDRLQLDVVHDMGLGWRSDVFQPHGGSRAASFEQNLLLLPPGLRPLKRQVAKMLPRYRAQQRLLARQYAEGGPLVIALSKMVARHMRDYHQVPEDRLRLIYNGVDVERFSPTLRETHRRPVREHLGVASHELLLLIVAHNFRLKGVPTLIRALGQLARERQAVRLVVAGGKQLRSYRKLADRVGAGDAITFLGPVDDPTPYYAAADVYVQPTLYDPCSLVVLEALACGLPVITTCFNGAGELLTEGEQGHVLNNPFDSRLLAERIAGLQDAAQRAQMGQSARTLAEQHSLDRNCQEIMTVYEEIANNRHGRAA